MTHKYPETCRVALFAGSFNPFTTGHASVVERALPLFDRIIIAIGVNAGKHSECSVEKRIESIAALYGNLPPGRVEVVAYHDELTVDLASRLGAGWLLRGVRSAKDFEYERDLADINRKLSGIETLLLYTLPELSCVSSSMVRELESYGHDVSAFLPTPLKLKK